MIVMMRACPNLKSAKIRASHRNQKVLSQRVLMLVRVDLWIAVMLARRRSNQIVLQEDFAFIGLEYFFLANITDMRSTKKLKTASAIAPNRCPIFSPLISSCIKILKSIQLIF